MNIRNASLSVVALSLVTLTGYASPPERQALVLPGGRATNISVVEKDNLGSYCADNSATLGCVVGLRERNQCIIFIQSGLPHETHGRVIVSESKRCFSNAADTRVVALPASVREYADTMTSRLTQK